MEFQHEISVYDIPVLVRERLPGIRRARRETYEAQVKLGKIRSEIRTLARHEVVELLYRLRKGMKHNDASSK